MRVPRRAAVAATGCALLFPLSATPAQTPAPPLSVLIVGGGPRPDYNQVAIESNVRYVGSLLPPNVPRRVLFADGRRETETVQYRQPDPSLPPAERAFRILFQRGEDGQIRYRAARLTQVDGPARKPALNAEIGRLSSATAAGPILLYFTGHGTRDPRGNLDNNVFALWEKGTEEVSTEAPTRPDLSVRELAREIARLPSDRPVALVMVQCYSGAFANILFKDGNPRGEMVDNPVCGFFATTRERVAAGCTPEINEAEYHDFTSYFFAALSGRDRLGRTVRAADYNRNGRIGMDEAFAYALIKEPSIDVPVATSDVFLRRYVTANDEEIAGTPYSQVRRLASPAQAAVLDSLSRALGSTEEDRLRTALADVRARVNQEEDEEMSHGGVDGRSRRRHATLLADWRIRLETRYPDLKRTGTPEWETAHRLAVAYLTGDQTGREDILNAAKGLEEAADARYADELTGARWLRLLRVAKTVLLEKRLREGGDAALIARFDRLRNLEAQNPLLGESATVARH